ncbi:3-dehydroquinate dehydratase-like protein [Purpureocillium lavendulum]|uniref:3-dehydroquinate dehydratase-like protein n=1 Tax=Purpureocillium lavendulum TaxID=1247861 RepID=A0AB34G3K3_9HYPO|nr:3-dehydroquinate dehydratase-like protein [Purpureocillium lavendulum]
MDEEQESPRAQAHDAAANDEPPPKQQWHRGPRRPSLKLPAWLDHFNSHDLKILLRCWTATWVATLLIFIGPSLRHIGLATFFGSLLLYIVPPASILFGYLLAALSLLFGMCLAWAWGLLTMKAALSARPAVDTQRQLQALQQQAVALAKQSGQSPAVEASVLVFQGFMLDARVTAVYYVMSCVFIYALARLRCSNGKLVAFQLFGTIITDLFLLIGPLLPSYNASLASILVKPGAIGIGLGIVCCILFFPQSTSYVVLDKMEKLVRMGETALDTTRRRLAGGELRMDELKGAKVRIISAYKALEPALAFLPLDFSRGRWNADDVKGLQAPVRDAMLAGLSLIDLHIARVDAKRKQLKLEQASDEHASATEKGIREPGQRQLHESADLMNALNTPEQAVMLTRALEALEGTTADVIQLCSESIGLVAKCIHTVNSRRWIGKPPQEEFDGLNRQLRETLTTLRAATATCITNTTEAILDSHADLFEEDGSLKSSTSPSPNSMRGVVISMVLEERILGTATALADLLEHVINLNAARTVHRIWVPSRIRYAVTWLFNGKMTVPVSGKTDAANDPDGMADTMSLEDQAVEAHRRLRISRISYGSAARRSAVSRGLVATFRWLFNPAGMYALRMVIVTIATGIPAAIPHSAGFFYREKGIWGVITAQTTLLVYMADFTFSLVSRGLGTIIGGVMGMVAWYIGSGSGIGNPYGLGAITAVMVAILIWWRLFLPPAFAQASIMSGATFALVVGFSWDQHHIQQYGLPGLGYEAFWKRLVTVLLGFLASFVVQLFPKPPSATNHVRKTLANTVRNLSDHYALLLSHWGHSDKSSPLGAVADQISLDVADTLMSVNGAISLLKIEMSFGPFDQQALRATQEKCQYINQSLGRLLDLSATLPRELQDRLAHVVGIADDRAIGDIMAVLGIIEQALRTGSPLPERLPAPLVRRFFDSWQLQHRHAILTKTLVRDGNYRRYCVAMSAYFKFLSTIDDLVLILKGTLGECHVIHEWEDV